MKSWIMTCFIAVIVIGSADSAAAFRPYAKAGAILIEMERGDTVWNVCRKLIADSRVPADFTGTEQRKATRCKNGVLEKNFGSSDQIGESYARNIRPGDVLIFPFISFSEHEKRVAKRTEAGVMARESQIQNSLKIQLAAAQTNIRNILIGAAILVLAIAVFVMIAEYRRNRDRRVLRRRVADLEYDCSGWKPGSQIQYEFVDDEYGRISSPVLVVGSGLKQANGGEVPYAIYRMPDGAEVHSYPANNIRNHLRKMQSRFKSGSMRQSNLANEI